MKAVGFFKPLPIGDLESLVDIELPKPTLKPHDLLVEVGSISVNPADVKIRASATPPENSARVLGYDAAGTIVEVGSEVSLFAVGDEVFYAGAIDRPGTYSQFHAVDERIVGRKPQSLNFAQAAALPLTSLTAWELLFDRLRVPYGEKTSNDAILVINGAGGVGSILIQLARRLTGLTIFATASRPETIAWSKAMGAHHVIDHRLPLDTELKKLGFSEVRYVAGLTATEEHLPAILNLLSPQGALALIDDPKVLDIVPFKRKSLSVHWELMFTRSLFTTPDIAKQHRILNEVSALVDAGVLKTTLNEDLGRIDAENLRRAHAAVESGRSIGKTVLSGF